METREGTRGGQGRSADEVQESASGWCVMVLVVACVLGAAWIGGVA